MDGGKVDLYDLAAIVASLRNATLRVVKNEMIIEIGKVLDSRLSSLVREDLLLALVIYQDSIAGRVEAAGSTAVEVWDWDIRLKSRVPICEEYERFVRLAALQLVLNPRATNFAACTFVFICSFLSRACGRGSKSLGEDQSKRERSVPSLHLARCSEVR